MGTAFQFVDGLSCSPDTKRLIRSHAMKGKNAGRKIHRPSKLKASTGLRRYIYPTSTASQTSTVLQSQGRQHEGQLCGRVDDDIGNVFLTLSFPVELGPLSLRVVNRFFLFVSERLYPTRLGLDCDQVKYMWLQGMFADEAACRCSVALMDACNEFVLDGRPRSPAGLRYHSQALALVNKRLQGRDALSDSTMSLVVSLILQEEMRNELTVAEIHYTGLRKMIELRGGLGQLEGNLSLALKVCKMDICYVLNHGGTIMFFRSQRLHCRPETYQSHAAISAWQKFLHPDLYDVLLDTMVFVTALNDSQGRSIFDISVLQEVVISACCRLIRFQQLTGSWHCALTEAVHHIGLTILLMTTFLQFDHRRVWKYPLVSRRLEDVIDSVVESGHDVQDDLLLWVLLVGGIWVLADGDAPWLSSRLRELLQRLEITDFTSCIDRVKNYPWIKALHNGPARAIWDMVNIKT